ncbi:ATP-dependent RNA helicase SrmB [Neiella sp. HB171785]|uniref:ATP-dependent RNA helicase SrmB n=1 Tax=Neiella litorisoli TaxID=2771431 RepID=A0A8J6UN52_9GAMM|nr:ATP-dependent RNA helicase SrmB [Neiella litorisoli]MBD1391395.1 ATP-dependent RNA helicase SrmB [Neiella litorisoli]
MDFADLDLSPKLLKALTASEYKRPTTIQQQMIPTVLDGVDVLANAPTGTGKTAAYLLPALQQLLDFPRAKSGPPRVLVLVPTRELAAQVLDYANKLSQCTHLDCRVLTGGVDHAEYAQMLKRNIDVLIATPGRLLEYLNQELIDPRQIETMIIDEADRTLEMGHGQDVEVIAAEARWRKQTLLLSATLEGNLVADFANRLLEEPIRIEANQVPRREKNRIHQWIHLADNTEHKRQLLLHYLKSEQTQKVIVFGKTRAGLAELADWLRSEGIEPFEIRGSMEQDKRNEALQRFSQQERCCILATDVAARGIDVRDISHVINFDMPRTADVYVHRIGRTGRAGAKGTAISLVEAHDMAQLERIERYIDEPLARRFVSGLRPKHKEAAVGKKGKPAKKPGKKKQSKKLADAVKPAKKRLRDKKNKGAPRWLKSKAEGSTSGASGKDKSNAQDS